MALSSEHGGAEGVAQRGGTGAQEHPSNSNRSEHRSRNAGPHALRSRAQRWPVGGTLWEGTRRPTQAITILCDQYSAPARPSDRRAPGCPTEHVLTGAHSIRSFDPATAGELIFPGSASGRLISAGDDGRRGARERHSNFIRLVSPVRRDGRRHGQTHVALSEQARDGRTAGLGFAAGMTARGCERSGGDSRYLCALARSRNSRSSSTAGHTCTSPSSNLSINPPVSKQAKSWAAALRSENTRSMTALLPATTTRSPSRTTSPLL